jgi:hypothetical protein
MSAREGPPAALATRRVPCDTAACLVGPCAWDRYLPPSATSVPPSKERDNGKDEAFCACCSGITAIFHRREFLRAMGIGGAALAFAPDVAHAAEGEYEAMVLACIDPRMQEPVHRYTVEQNLTGKFSQFVIAGAAIGVRVPGLAQSILGQSRDDDPAAPHQEGHRHRPSRLRRRQDRLWRGESRNPAGGNRDTQGGACRIPQASWAASPAARGADRPHGA